MNITDYLAGAEFPEASSPLQTWDDYAQALSSSNDPDFHVAATVQLCRSLHGTRGVTAADANQVFTTSPVGRWAGMITGAWSVVDYSALSYHRLIAATTADHPGDALHALNLWATAALYFHELDDILEALTHTEQFLALTDGRGWTRPDTELAEIVLFAAVEANDDSPAGKIGQQLMDRYGERLVTAVETADPDFAYEQLSLLRAWQASQHV